MNKIVNISLLGSDNTLVVANYTKISENIRRLTPHGIQCSIFCGGSHCKYENPESWTADSLALQGIYSHWITDNILAMARPSTAVIIKKNIIQQFQSLGIKSIINLQCAKEHASCGEPLEESGFSYEPNVFMENDIYYYNFAWKDYGDATLSSLLSMIKVLAFATKEGRVAVHCHAGLGRTGVLIACYLVYSLRVTANDAIKYVRLRRPRSVQTRGQIICVRQFAQFILPKNITYFLKDSKDKYMTEFTLQRFLSRQKIVLHGYDERNFKFVPKIVHVICERILQLCGCHTDEFELSNMSITTDFLCSTLHGNVSRNESLYNISSNLSEHISSSSDLPTRYDNSLSPVSPNQSENDEQASLSQLSDSFSDLSNLDEEDIQHELKDRMLQENKCFQELQTQKTYENTSIPDNIYPVGEVVNALLFDTKTTDECIKQSVLRYKNEINTSQVGWLQLQLETNLIILTTLLFEWLECLKMPVLNKEKLETIVTNYQQPENCFKKLGLEEGYLIEYLLHFLTKVNPISPEDLNQLLIRIIASLAQQTVTLNEKQIPSGKSYRRLGEGTLNCTTKFLQKLMELMRRLHLKSSTVHETQ